MTNAYEQSGVDVNAGYEVVNRIKKHAERTKRLGTLGALGGFGGCFDLSDLAVKEPVLVSGTDGVGTKILLAIQENQHQTIGIDCVAMCVNDIVAQGAEPLYFLDYVAVGKNHPEQIEQIVSGIADGCLLAGAALIGGETAEMPGLYDTNEYDLAGFSVGIAEKSQLITGEKISEGDVLIGLAASGIHSNGYSLVRKIFFGVNTFKGSEYLPELCGKTLAEELLTPTKIYVQAILPLVKKELINGVAHITGGGFIENIPRMLSSELSAEIHLNTWPVLPIFEVIKRYGQISENEMYEIFNMGIGMVLSVSKENVSRVCQLLHETNEKSYLIGQVVKRQKKPIYFKEV